MSLARTFVESLLFCKSKFQSLQNITKGGGVRGGYKLEYLQRYKKSLDIEGKKKNPGFLKKVQSFFSIKFFQTLVILLAFPEAYVELSVFISNIES